ncbi:MAG: metal-dependent hydrolase [Rhodocyclaceae bacterium]|nr:metal-dependent hydrolase [Rhodocyclaceae bacterium]
MDRLTQGLLGAAAAQVVLGKRLGHRGWIAGAIGGLLPDADILIRSTADPLLAIEYHRHFTHSLAFIPPRPHRRPLPWLAFRKQRPDAKLRSPPPPSAVPRTACSMPAPPTARTCTWPFSDERTAWNLIATIGPLFTLFLLVGVVLAALRSSRFPAIAALCLCLAYVGVAGLQRGARVRGARGCPERAGHTVARAEIFPTVGNPLVWRSLSPERARCIRRPHPRAPFAASRPGWPATACSRSPWTIFRRRRPPFARPPRFPAFQLFLRRLAGRAPRDASVIADARYSLATPRVRADLGRALRSRKDAPHRMGRPRPRKTDSSRRTLARDRWAR